MNVQNEYWHWNKSESYFTKVKQMKVTSRTHSCFAVWDKVKKKKKREKTSDQKIFKTLNWNYYQYSINELTLLCPQLSVCFSSTLSLSLSLSHAHTDDIHFSNHFSFYMLYPTTPSSSANLMSHWKTIQYKKRKKFNTKEMCFCSPSPLKSDNFNV